MFYYHHDLTTALHSKLNGSLRICGLKQLNHAKQARFWQLRERTHQRFSFDTQVSQLVLDTTVEDALAFYYSTAHRSHYIYVVDALGVLYGVIYGHMLPTLAVKQAPIGLYMEQVHKPIVAEHDRDFVAAQLQQQRTLELPVVDHDHRLVGVVDIDDLG